MSAKRKTEAGFTIVEVIISIIVLTVGLLGLVTTAALVTRMITRGQRSAEAATFAARRMERLRPRACIPSQRTAGSDTLSRGGTWRAINSWVNPWVRCSIIPLIFLWFTRPARRRWPSDLLFIAPLFPWGQLPVRISPSSA